MRISDWSSDVCSSDLISEGWRKFLMTSRGKIGHMDTPAATAEQSSLYHVVTHDIATHGFIAAKFWQTAAFGEGTPTQYGVVTHESCFVSRPQDEVSTRASALSRVGRHINRMRHSMDNRGTCTVCNGCAPT